MSHTPRYRKIPVGVIGAQANAPAAAAAVNATPALLRVPTGTIYALANTTVADGDLLVMIVNVDGLLNVPGLNKRAVAISNTSV